MSRPPSLAAPAPLTSGGIASFAAGVASSQTVAFADATGMLRLAQLASFAAAITGFAQGNTIDFAGITANTATWTDAPSRSATGREAIAARRIFRRCVRRRQ